MQGAAQQTMRGGPPQPGVLPRRCVGQGPPARTGLHVQPFNSRPALRHSQSIAAAAAQKSSASFDEGDTQAATAPRPSLQDWDNDYTVVRENATALEEEILRLKAENDALRQRIHTRVKPPAAASSSTAKPKAAVAPAERKAASEAEPSLRPFSDFLQPAAEPSTPQPSAASPPALAVQGSLPTAAPAVAEVDEEKLVAQFEEEKERLQKQQPTSSTPQAEKVLDIVFVSAECAPWSKTGGLGDVVGSLPLALAKRGHRVMVVVPRYLNGVDDHKYECAHDTGMRLWLDLGAAGTTEVGYFHYHHEGADFVFVDHPCFHRAGNPYGDEHGVFGDNVFRYSVLSMAACEAPLALPIGGYRSGEPPGFPYGDNCIFMANDWHASLVPVYLAAKYRRHGVYTNARCILAIHNLAHQGVEPAATFGNFGLPEDWYDPVSWEYPSWSHMGAAPAVNLLKGGILSADRVMTVSQGYAWEITTKEGGWGLDDVLKSRQHVLNGIVNGIDTEEWNPEDDKYIAAPFSASDLSGKAQCKAALQQELGFKVDPSIPLLGFIGRLDFQKGPDVALDAVPGLANMNCQFVMLGSGHDEYENCMRAAESAHPQHFRGWVGFSIPVAHRMIAGCDILLMPSRFEPCGLNQLFAMRYGTIPLAHATGGLRDTIEDFSTLGGSNEVVGTGFTFGPPDAQAMLSAVGRALHTFRSDPRAWQGLMRNGMQRDLSWDCSAQQYEQLFEWALMDQAHRPW